MTNLAEQPEWAEGIRQLETSDPVEGGPDGVDNIAPRQLASRTSWLRRVLQFGRTTWAPDTGTKNNIVANLSPAVAELLDGMEANFRVAFTNDGPCTFTPNGAAGSAIPKLPLYGGDHADLDAGDLPAGAQVRARLNKALNVANGGAWVIKSISGGMARTLTPPAGDMSGRVASMAALFAATDGFQTVDVAGKTDTLLAAAQYGVAMLRLTGELTGNKSVLLPKQPGQWIVENAATGDYNLNAAVSGGGGTWVVMPVGSPVILCSDGKNVKFASAGGQAAIRAVPITGKTGTSLTITGGYTPGAVLIEKNGALLQPGTAASPDFLATDGVKITFTEALVETDALTLYVFSTFTVANAVKKSGDAMGGPLALYAGSTMPAPAEDDNSQSVIPSAWVHPLAAHGQCRLSVASPTSLKLSRHNGACLNITGTIRQIPAAGVTITNAGLAASTLYYVYAFMNAGVMALELATTTHATDTSGVEIRSGDATRTLVGLICTNSSGQFVNSITQRFCMNWFHREDQAVNANGGQFSITSAASIEISPAVRIEFLVWANDAVPVLLSGNFRNNTASQGISVAATVDGTQVTPSQSWSSPTANQASPFCSTSILSYAEGYHIAKAVGAVSGGTGTWETLNLSARVRG